MSTKELLVGMGCFWGAERRMWQQAGVVETSVGYAGGHTTNPTYKQVCEGDSNHVEVVRVVYDPQQTSLQALLKVFFESHDPTQGMRQGNDIGTQYRSCIYWFDAEDESVIRDVTASYARALATKGVGAITTELRAAKDTNGYFLAEDYHQRYLEKNPNGYCGLKGTGVMCAI